MVKNKVMARCKLWGHSAVSCVKRLNRSRYCWSCGLGWAQGICIRWGPDHPMGRGNFGEKRCPL